MLDKIKGVFGKKRKYSEKEIEEDKQPGPDISEKSLSYSETFSSSEK